jgi:hypothetical protein
MSPSDSSGPQVSPTDEEIITIAADIRTKTPALGIAKVLLAIKKSEPTWILSEKVQVFLITY